MGIQGGGGGWSTVAGSLLAKPCDSCKTSAAALFCRADSAFLCLTCDARIHPAANKLSTRHERVWMCEVCEHAPAAVTCKADAAALCVTCDADIHSANPLARRHDRVPVEPFFDSVESIIVKSTAAASSIASLNFLVPNGEVSSDTTKNLQNDAESTWLIPNPNLNNSKLEMDIAPDIIKSSGDVFFPEMDSLLEFDYPNPIQNFSGSGNDSVVPVQPDPLPLPSLNINYPSATEKQNCFDLDFCRSKLSSSFSYPSQSLSQSVSSSSLDVGVVPDGNSMSEISYPFGSHNVSDLGVPVSATTAAASQPATQLTGLDREARVLRYREKRKNRKFQKTIRYASRKAYAETRPRIKGRFAKRTETETETVGVVNNHIFGSGTGNFISEHQYGVVPTFCQ